MERQSQRKDSQRTIVVLCICLLMFPQYGASFWLPENEIEIHPSDTLYFFVGDVVRVYCSVQESSEVDDIYFHASITSARETRLTVNKENSTHVFTDLEGTKEMVGINTVSCQREESDALPTSINFFVQEKLRPVIKFSSIWWFSNDTVKLSWDLGTAYFRQDLYMSVEAKWKGNDRNTTGGHDCDNATMMSCSITLKTSSGGPSILFFTVVVKTIEEWWKLYKANENYFLTPQIERFQEANYDFDPMTKVQPKAPTGVTIEGTSSHCFNVSWVNPSFFRNIDQDTHVLIAVQKEQSSTVLNREITNSTLRYLSHQTMTACGLHPATLYTLTLQVKPVQGGYWTEPVEFPVTTEESIPSVGPEMTSTCFWVGNCVKGQRDGLLYWKDLKAQDTNGKLTNFQVKLNSKSVEVRGSSNHMKIKIDCAVEYEVEVYSATAVGLTSKPSRLVIPSEDQALQVDHPIDLKVEKLTEPSASDQVSINVTWNFQDEKSSKDVTLILYYCKGETFTPKVCINDFTTERVPLEYQSLVLPNVTGDVDRIGYALESGDKVRGITWIECIFDRNQAPPRVADVSAYPGEERGTIRVSWKRQQCSQVTMALVLFYRVEYSGQSEDSMGAQGAAVVMVEGSGREVVLTGLDVEQIYTIKVSAKTHSGYGMASDPVLSKAGKGASSEDLATRNVVIILSIIFPAILGAIIFLLFRRKCQSRKRKMQCNIPDYTAFEIVSKTKDETVQQSDSGVSTGALGGDEEEDVSPYTIVRHGSYSPEEVRPVCPKNPAPPIPPPLYIDSRSGSSSISSTRLFSPEKSADPLSDADNVVKESDSKANEKEPRNSDGAILESQDETASKSYISHPFDPLDVKVANTAERRERESNSSADNPDDYLRNQAPYIKAADNPGSGGDIHECNSSTDNSDDYLHHLAHQPNMKTAVHPGSGGDIHECNSSTDNSDDNLRNQEHSPYIKAAGHPGSGEDIHECNSSTTSGGSVGYASKWLHPLILKAAGNLSANGEIHECNSSTTTGGSGDEHSHTLGSSRGIQAWDADNSSSDTAVSFSDDYLSHAGAVSEVWQESGTSQDIPGHKSKDPYMKVADIPHSGSRIQESRSDAVTGVLDGYVTTDGLKQRSSPHTVSSTSESGIMHSNATPSPYLKAADDGEKDRGKSKSKTEAVRSDGYVSLATNSMPNVGEEERATELLLTNLQGEGWNPNFPRQFTLASVIETRPHLSPEESRPLGASLGKDGSVQLNPCCDEESISSNVSSQNPYMIAVDIENSSGSSNNPDNFEYMTKIEAANVCRPLPGMKGTPLLLPAQPAAPGMKETPLLLPAQPAAPGMEESAPTAVHGCGNSQTEESNDTATICPCPSSQSHLATAPSIPSDDSAPSEMEVSFKPDCRSNQPAISTSLPGIPGATVDQGQQTSPPPTPGSERVKNQGLSLSVPYPDVGQDDYLPHQMQPTTFYNRKISEDEGISSPISLPNPPEFSSV